MSRPTSGGHTSSDGASPHQSASPDQGQLPNDSAPPSESHRRATWLSVLAGVVVFIGGVVIAGQSRANGTLNLIVGDPIVTAILSTGSGWIGLCLMLGKRRSRAAFGKLAEALRSRSMPWWMVTGGSFGALVVTTQAFAVPIAGVALVTICVVAGQTTTAIGVDRLGIGPAGVQPVSRARILSAALALVGVGIAVGPRVTGGGTHLVLPVLLALTVGALLAFQAAMNGQVNRIGGSAATTTWINFSWALLIVCLVEVVRLAQGTAWPDFRLLEGPWWAWTGGILGATYVALIAICVARLGVLLVTLLSVTGQLFGALVLDLLDPTLRHLVTVSTVTGVVLTLVASFGAALAANRASRLARARARDLTPPAA